MVVRFEPLSRTTEPVTNLVPVSVIVNCAEPTSFEFGEIVVRVGTGLFTVKVTALDVPPPGVGLKTVISNVPTAVISEAGIVASSLVLLI